VINKDEYETDGNRPVKSRATGDRGSKTYPSICLIPSNVIMIRELIIIYNNDNDIDNI